MNLVNDKFQLFAQSVSKAGKDKCGDAFVVHELSEENLIILAVADGVSSLPCDWLASKTACETVVFVFAQTEGSTSHRMKTAADKADKAIKTVYDSCKGTMTSLSLAVWQTTEDKIHFLNVGDSRIYVGPEAKLKQITVDDTISVLVRRDGEVLLNAGMPIFMWGVTRSLGQGEPLAFEVATCDFSSKDLLLLVSDGICKNDGFTSDLKNIFSRNNLAEQLSQLVRENSEKNKDDATLIVLWRTEKDEKQLAIYEECVKEKSDFRNKELSGQNVIEFLQNDLLNALAQNSNEKVIQLLDYAFGFNLKFSRAFLSDFISLVIKQGTDRNLVFRLRELIKSS
jgi:serine/threonine protein phosphatase PrpC